MPRMIDGSEADEEYLARLYCLGSAACDAEEVFTLDELEEATEFHKARRRRADEEDQG